MLLKSPNTRFLDWTVKNTSHHIEQIKKRIPLVQFKNTSRLVCSLGRDYAYSKQTTVAHSFNLYPPIYQLMLKLNKELNTNFNSCLINYYPANTSVGIGTHKDDESSLISNIVASVSLGQEVPFVLKDTYKGIPNESIEVILKDGDVFVMAENCQKYYFHSIPYNKYPTERISLTFREFK